MGTDKNIVINIKKRWILFAVINLLTLITAVLYLMVGILIEERGHIFSMCLMHDIMRLYCPACGGTRAVKAILSFDFLTALKCNPTVLLTFIYFLYYDMYALVNIIKKKKKVIERIHPFAPISLLVVFIGFGILRNILLVYFNVDFIGDFR